MRKRILDTSELIAHWRRCIARGAVPARKNAVRRWAQELIEIHESNAIVSPVYVEFVAGARSRGELEMFRVYLSEFRVVDAGKITKEDWEAATRRAERVPRDGKPRQLGDCLVDAIAERLRCEVRSLDRRMIR
jgi:predicted nucleic acid-binding protein